MTETVTGTWKDHIRLITEAFDRITKERDGWKSECERQATNCGHLREKLMALDAAADKDVWYYQGDGYDHPESLTCHVVMRTEQFRGLMAKQKPAEPLALDVSMERSRALHRVWRALNDGDCPACHTHNAAEEMYRPNGAVNCPNCAFGITAIEIADLQQMFAPAMNAAMELFLEW